MRRITFECNAHEANLFNNRKEDRMNNKFVAVAVIAMMVVAGVALVSDTSEANEPIDGTYGVTIYAGDPAGQSVLLKYNESAYNHYTNESTLKVVASSSKITDVTSALYSNNLKDGAVPLSNLTFTLTQPNNNVDEGNYWLNVTADEDATAGTYYVAVQFQVTLTINGVEVPVTPVYTEFTVTVKDPESITVSVSDDYPSIGTVGQNFVSWLKVSGVSFVGSVHMYAVLPDGLAIASSGSDVGMITGMPAEPATETDYAVYVTDTATGIVYKGTVMLTINDASDDPNGSISVSVKAGNSPVSLKQGTNTYYIEQGTENLTYTVSATGGVLTSVRIIDTTAGAGQVGPEVPTESGTVTGDIDTAGTGSYMIFAEGISNNGQYISAVYNIEVYAHTLEVTAEIIVSSS